MPAAFALCKDGHIRTEITYCLTTRSLALAVALLWVLAALMAALCPSYHSLQGEGN